jgi:hypothetical protein
MLEFRVPATPMVPSLPAMNSCHDGARNETVKSFHLPLPEQTHARLRAEEVRTQVPATTLAREAVDGWLRQHSRNARQDAIATYAAEVAGTGPDLDTDLESAGIEYPVRPGRATR